MELKFGRSSASRNSPISFKISTLMGYIFLRHTLNDFINFILICYNVTLITNLVTWIFSLFWLFDYWFVNITDCFFKDPTLFHSFPHHGTFEPRGLDWGSEIKH